MRCPNCGNKLKVLSTRDYIGNTTQRLLECPSCGTPYTSYEFISDDHSKLLEYTKGSGNG